MTVGRSIVLRGMSRGRRSKKFTNGSSGEDDSEEQQAINEEKATNTRTYPDGSGRQQDGLYGGRYTRGQEGVCGNSTRLRSEGRFVYIAQFLHVFMSVSFLALHGGKVGVVLIPLHHAAIDGPTHEDPLKSVHRPIESSSPRPPREHRKGRRQYECAQWNVDVLLSIDVRASARAFVRPSGMATIDSPGSGTTLGNRCR